MCRGGCTPAAGSSPHPAGAGRPSCGNRSWGGFFKSSSQVRCIPHPCSWDPLLSPSSSVTPSLPFFILPSHFPHLLSSAASGCPRGEGSSRAAPSLLQPSCAKSWTQLGTRAVAAAGFPLPEPDSRLVGNTWGNWAERGNLPTAAACCWPRLNPAPCAAWAEPLWSSPGPQSSQRQQGQWQWQAQEGGLGGEGMFC